MRGSQRRLVSLALRAVPLVALVCTLSTPGRAAGEAPSGAPVGGAEQGGTALTQIAAASGQPLAAGEAAGPDQQCAAAGGTSRCVATAASGSSALLDGEPAGAPVEPAPNSDGTASANGLPENAAASAATGGQEPDGHEQQAAAVASGSPALAADQQQAAAAAGAALQQPSAHLDQQAQPESQQQSEPPPPQQQPEAPAPTGEAIATPAPVPPVPEEEHHNFALSKDGAKVLASNREAKKASALLDDDPDTFLKNDCRAEAKWVMLELSQVAKVSRLELSQNELYSARVREFEVLGRQSHPRTDGVGAEYGRSLNSSQWKLLGNFTAEKAKGSQVFAIERPRWVRYLLLRFLSQHGGEAVCALNGVAVFGRSAVEELEDQLAAEEGLGLLPPDLEIPAPAPEPAAAAVPSAAAVPAAKDIPLPTRAPEAGAAAAAAAQGAADAAQAEQGQPGGVPPAEQPGEQQQQQQAQAPAQQQPGAGDSGGVPALQAGDAAQAGSAPLGTPSSGAPGNQPQPPDTAAGTQTASNDSGNGFTSTTAAPSTVGSRDAVRAGSNEPPGAGQPLDAQPTAGRQPGTAQQTDLPPGSATQPAAPMQGVASASAANLAVQQPAEQQQRQQEQQPPLGNAIGGGGGANDSQPQVIAATSTATGSPAAPAPVQPPPQQQQQQPQQQQQQAPAPPAGSAALVPPAGATAPAPAPAPAPAVDAEEVLELPLARLTAKGKSGGSVYELLVQEIKAAKLQHKLLAKGVAEVARNASAAYAELAGDLASLAAAVAKIPADRNSSEEALAVQVDVLVKAHLLQVSQQMLGLQAALASAAKQQHALLCFLAMMGGVLALNGTRFAEQWPRAQWAVLLLAAANGLVGVVLQLQGSAAARPGYWLQALPGWAQ